jgi:hypothetical protein
MATVETEVRIICKCGGDLDELSTEQRTRCNSATVIEVGPCARCISDAKDAVREEMQEEIDALKEQLASA